MREKVIECSLVENKMIFNEEWGVPTRIDFASLDSSRVNQISAFFHDYFRPSAKNASLFSTKNARSVSLLWAKCENCFSFPTKWEKRFFLFLTK